MADIFVSYTSSDRDWAFWIAKGWVAAQTAYCDGRLKRRRHYA
jgi:hypothetical protein